MSRLSTVLNRMATLIMGHDATIGDTPITTTAQTLTGAVNELDSDISSLNSNIGLNEIYGSASVNNANDAERFKWYFVFTSAQNVPEQGILFTYGETTSYSQVLFGYRNIYVRRYYQGAWTTWYKCAGATT